MLDHPISRTNGGESLFQLVGSVHHVKSHAAALIGRLQNQMRPEFGHRPLHVDARGVGKQKIGGHPDAGFTDGFFGQVLVHAKPARFGTASAIRKTSFFKQRLEGSVFSESSMNGRKHNGVGGVQASGQSFLGQIDHMGFEGFREGFGQGHAGRKGHFSFRAGPSCEYGDACFFLHWLLCSG